MPLDSPKIPGTLAALIKGLVTALANNGKFDEARQIVEEARMACDEATAYINSKSR